MQATPVWLEQQRTDRRQITPHRPRRIQLAFFEHIRKHFTTINTPHFACISVITHQYHTRLKRLIHGTLHSLPLRWLHTRVSDRFLKAPIVLDPCWKALGGILVRFAHTAQARDNCFCDVFPVGNCGSLNGARMAWRLWSFSNSSNCCTDQSSKSARQNSDMTRFAFSSARHLRGGSRTTRICFRIH